MQRQQPHPSKASSSFPAPASSQLAAGNGGRNALLLERVKQLEQEVETLRQGAPYVDESVVRSFLTQMDLAYTEDLERQVAVSVAFVHSYGSPHFRAESDG